MHAVVSELVIVLYDDAFSDAPSKIGIQRCLGVGCLALTFVFTGFQQPVNRRLDSCCCCCWGRDQVAELQLKQWEAAKVVC